MNIVDLTLGQIKQIQSMLGGISERANSTYIDKFYIGKKCIIRTYSAGCWFGEIAQKDGEEIILNNARRLHRWKPAKSISLSAVAKYGLDENVSDLRICPTIESVWLNQIEILPCTGIAIKSIEGYKDVEAE